LVVFVCVCVCKCSVWMSKQNTHTHTHTNIHTQIPLYSVWMVRVCVRELCDKKTTFGVFLCTSLISSAPNKKKNLKQKMNHAIALDHLNPPNFIHSWWTRPESPPHQGVSIQNLVLERGFAIWGMFTRNLWSLTWILADPKQSRWFICFVCCKWKFK